MAMSAGESTGRALYSNARSGGARALGRPAAGLETGAVADIVALADDISADPEAMLNRWIFGSRFNLVDTVWRYGRVVVKDGRHVSRDAIAARYKASIARLTA